MLSEFGINIMSTCFDKGILRYLDENTYSYLKDIRLLFLGVGGLGSNSAVNLARCGFSKFILVDHDKVDFSNLNRQYFFANQTGMHKTHALKENLLKINKSLEIETITKKIESKEDFQSFENCDAVIEGFDGSFHKKITAEYFMKKESLLVQASGIAGYGRSDNIVIKKIRNNFFMVGDFETGIDENNRPFCPYVTIAAAKQADIVFSYFCNKAVENKM